MKRIFTSFIFLLLTAASFAYDAKIGGIYYNFSGTEATVTYGDNNPYTGSVVIPETVTYNGTTYSVTGIGDLAFQSDTGLTSVTIGNNVATIGYSAFRFCTGLTSITIGNSVKTIGNNAFSGCRGLTSVNIPNSVMTIEEYAFGNCNNLTSITIPNSVTKIGSSAFWDTAWYSNQPDGLVYAGMVVYKYKGTMPDNATIVLNEGTRGIAGSAFNGCFRLTSVIIPNSVITIGDGAFAYYILLLFHTSVIYVAQK